MHAVPMKKIVLTVLSLILVIMLSGCTVLYVLFSAHPNELSHSEYVHKLSGLDISGNTVVFEEDSHGGFLGDGSLIVKFDCTEISDSVLEQVKQWRPLPLSQNLQLIMYGKSINGMVHGYNYAQRHNIPIITNGSYYFWDRHSESTNAISDASLLSRASFNFSLLLFDSDNCMLYLFELDT